MTILTLRHCLICYKYNEPGSTDFESVNLHESRRKNGEVCHRFCTLVSRYLPLTSSTEEEEGHFQPEKTIKTKLTMSLTHVCDECFPVLETYCKMYDIWQRLQLKMNLKLEEISGLMEQADEVNDKRHHAGVSPVTDRRNLELKLAKMGETMEEINKFRNSFKVAVGLKSRSIFPRLDLEKHLSLPLKRNGSESGSDDGGSENEEVDNREDDHDDLFTPIKPDKKEAKESDEEKTKPDLESKPVVQVVSSVVKNLSKKFHWSEGKSRRTRPSKVPPPESPSLRRSPRNQPSCKVKVEIVDIIESDDDFRFQSLSDSNKCPMCPASLKADNDNGDADQLKHLLVHTREHPYICHCGKEFSDHSKLATHEQVHVDNQHSEKKNRKKCPVASPETHAKKKFSESPPNPDAQSSDKKLFPCPYCHHVFDRSSKLAQHRKIHSVSRRTNKFSCVFCQKSFKSKTTLDKHLLEHTVEYPYKCEECKEKFLHHTDFQIHHRKCVKKMTEKNKAESSSTASKRSQEKSTKKKVIEPEPDQSVHISSDSDDSLFTAVVVKKKKKKKTRKEKKRDSGPNQPQTSDPVNMSTTISSTLDNQKRKRKRSESFNSNTPDLNRNNDSKQFKCKSCNKKFKEEEDLQNHENELHSSKNFAVSVMNMIKFRKFDSSSVPKKAKVNEETNVEDDTEAKSGVTSPSTSSEKENDASCSNNTKKKGHQGKSHLPTKPRGKRFTSESCERTLTSNWQLSLNRHQEKSLNSSATNEEINMPMPVTLMNIKKELKEEARDELGNESDSDNVQSCNQPLSLYENPYSSVTIPNFVTPISYMFQKNFDPAMQLSTALVSGSSSNSNAIALRSESPPYFELALD